MVKVVCVIPEAHASMSRTSGGQDGTNAPLHA
jgi:hypothetical protein